MKSNKLYQVRIGSVPGTLRNCTWYTFLFLFISIGFTAENYNEPPITEEDRNHWAFQPLYCDSDCKSIDEFLLQKLGQEGIDDFAPRANRNVLLRRLYITMHGLPPGDEELQNFRAGDLPQTLEKLLASHHYGERWAQHWLDVARFAETDGFEHDKTRPEAWRYRDWVIDSLNRDLPYDQFVAQQIAGDELVPGTDARLGTGFLFAGPDMPDINLESERRHTVLNETTGAVGTAFLGLTIGCAQCHDHKDDPVSQADFYRLRAFFDNAKLPPKNRSLPHLFQENGVEISSKSILRIRGDFQRTGPELQPAFLRVVNHTGSQPQINKATESSGRRTALAQWLTDPRQNPLLARVMVNRVWQQHFGTGLVPTPNDFGTTGTPPSHPELLEWLALDFIENDWSLKHLHRRIVLSRAWQQTSLPVADSEKRRKLDPENTLLSRRLPLRLSGEVIRDCMLAATGDLHTKTGGPGFRPPLPKEVTVTLLKNQWPVTEDIADHNRRSIYLFARRNLRYPLFDLFDRPDANLPCGRRHTSTTAPQSLFLLNSRFSEARASRLADTIKIEPDTTSQIRLAYRKTVARDPAADEISAAQKFIDTESLEMFCLALFNQNEFVYLD